MTTPIEPLMLNYEEAAKALSMSRQALCDLVYKGQGPIFVKIGRRKYFTPQDLRNFVEERRQVTA